MTADDAVSRYSLVKKGHRPHSSSVSPDSRAFVKSRHLLAKILAVAVPQSGSLVDRRRREQMLNRVNRMRRGLAGIADP
jgi:hypothetical protein